MKRNKLILLIMGVAIIPYFIQIGESEDDSGILIPGSKYGGQDVIFRSGDSQKDVTLNRSNVTLLDHLDLNDGIKLTGSALIAWSHGLTSPMLTSEMQLGNTGGTGIIFVVMVNIPNDTTLTGAAWFQTVQGGYTATNYNGLALYTRYVDPETGLAEYDLIAYTANDTSIWKQINGATYKRNFITPVAVTAGNYWLMLVYDPATETTKPKIAAAPNVIHLGISNLDSQSDIKTYQGVDTNPGNPLPPSSFGTYTSDVRRPWLAVY